MLFFLAALGFNLNLVIRIISREQGKESENDSELMQRENKQLE